MSDSSTDMDPPIDSTPTNDSLPPTNDSNTSISNMPPLHSDDLLLPHSDSQDTLLTMCFNQDGGCLAIGTRCGFRICNVSPFRETFRRQLDDANISRIEMLYRTNLLALNGQTARFPANKVHLYDDHLQRTIGELSFRQKVLTVRLRRDRIVVVLSDRIYVYNFADLALLERVMTGENPRGLLGISLDNAGVGGGAKGEVGWGTTDYSNDNPTDASMGATNTNTATNTITLSSSTATNGLVLACPSTKQGQVRVELYGLRRTTFIDAHESALGALALSVDGSLLATASERGTVIRLFDTRGATAVGGGGIMTGRKLVDSTGKKETALTVTSSILLREFRRGVERATITCLTFSIDSCWLAAASDHGTVHIFQSQVPNANNKYNIPQEVASNEDGASSSTSSLSSMTGKALRMIPKMVVAPTKYLMEGEHSYAQVRGVPHPRACAFVPDRHCTIAVAGEDEHGNGCLLLAEFAKSPTILSKKDAETSKAKNNSSTSDDYYYEPRRVGYYRFFKKHGSAAATTVLKGKNRHRSKSKEWKSASEETGEVEGAYIDDTPINAQMNHIHIGDEDEDEFVPIDYREKQF